MEDAGSTKMASSGLLMGVRKALKDEVTVLAEGKHGEQAKGGWRRQNFSLLVIKN